MQVLEVFLSYVYRLVNLLIDKNNDLWVGVSEESFAEIVIALSDCLSRLSSPYGLNNVSNHQYLRLISLILTHEQFHQPGMKDSYFLVFTIKTIRICFSFTT